MPAPPPLRSLKIVAVAARPAHPACLRGNPRRFVVGAACVQARRRVHKKKMLLAGGQRQVQEAQGWLAEVAPLQTWRDRMLGQAGDGLCADYG